MPKLGDLRAGEIAAWEAGLPPRFRYSVVRALRQVLDAAIAVGRLARNPAKATAAEPCARGHRPTRPGTRRHRPPRRRVGRRVRGGGDRRCVVLPAPVGTPRAGAGRRYVGDEIPHPPNASPPTATRRHRPRRGDPCGSSRFRSRARQALAQFTPRLDTRLLFAGPSGKPYDIPQLPPPPVQSGTRGSGACRGRDPVHARAFGALVGARSRDTAVRRRSVRRDERDDARAGAYGLTCSSRAPTLRGSGSTLFTPKPRKTAEGGARCRPRRWTRLECPWFESPYGPSRLENGCATRRSSLRIGARSRSSRSGWSLERLDARFPTRARGFGEYVACGSAGVFACPASTSPFFLGLDPTYDPALFGLIDALKGGVFVDAGASIGFTAVRAARRAGPVVAVEPHPVRFAYLERNVKLNGLTNITCFNCALGSADGMVSMFDVDRTLGPHTLDPSTRPGSGPRFDVRLCRLDELVEGSVTLFKVDVEGAELEMYRGAADLLSSRPLVHVESLGGTPVICREFLLHYSFERLAGHNFLASPRCSGFSERSGQELATEEG